MRGPRAAHPFFFATNEMEMRYTSTQYTTMVELKKKKRIRVYIDAANLILSARTHGIVYDIAVLGEYLRYKYSASSCVYFTGRISALASDYNRIEKLGIEIVFKEIYSEHAKTKANCDVDISHRITKDVERKDVDGVVLLSGDGDFAALLDYVKNSGMETYLFAIHRQDTSRLLRKRGYLRTTWLSDIYMKILQRKGSAEINVSAERLFDVKSIQDATPTVN
jgi:uncharacterized LabA/DUF88 family protein